MDQPGKVANPARGQLNREIIFPCPRACLRIWSREMGLAVPSGVSLLISILRLNAIRHHRLRSIGSVPEFIGSYIFDYRLCSPPRVRRHRASINSRQGSYIDGWFLLRKPHRPFHVHQPLFSPQPFNVQ